MRVVTYREAYRVSAAWSLCGAHAADSAEPARRAAGIGPLGPVIHGAHRGACAAEALLIAAGCCAEAGDLDREAARRALAHIGDRYLHPTSPGALLVAEDVKREARSLIERLSS